MARYIFEEVRGLKVDIEEIKGFEDVIFEEILKRSISFEQYREWSKVLSVIRLALFETDYNIKLQGMCIDFVELRGVLNV